MYIGETDVKLHSWTLFNTNCNLNPSTHHEKEVNLHSNTFELIENNMKLKLTIKESVGKGFGDQIIKENSNQKILD